MTATFWVCAVTCGAVALAQSPGTFTTTGAMAASRVQHAATLLATGKVLITGGVQDSVLASAELYDPSSGTFSPTGSLTTPRGGHTATLLANGRVLITGGFPALGAAPGLASAEVYDPALGVFTRTGDMAQARAYHAATLLANGKVLIAGGWPNSTQIWDPTRIPDAELYDAVTGTFTPAGVFPFIASQVTLLNDGNALVQGTSADGKAAAALDDPATAAFAPTGQPVVSLAPLETTMLTNGRVLNAAFDDCGWPTDAAELYDPSTGAFTAEKLTAPRRGASATLLSNGTVLIAGGGVSGSGWLVGATSGAELYDPVMNTFAATGYLGGNREDHTATLLPDGTVLVAGGWRFGVGDIADAEIYHPSVLLPSPVLLTAPGSSTAAILHAANQQVVSSSNPAVAGEALEIFGTGLIDGSVIPPQVAIGGLMAEVLFFGKAPGYAGLNQINVRVPSGVVTGPSVSVRLNYIGRPSNEVTLAVQ